MKMPKIERREGEGDLQYGARRMRALAFEEAATAAEAEGSAGSYTYQKACKDIAKRLRKMAEEW